MGYLGKRNGQKQTSVCKCVNLVQTYTKRLSCNCSKKWFCKHLICGLNTYGSQRWLFCCPSYCLCHNKMYFESSIYDAFCVVQMVKGHLHLFEDSLVTLWRRGGVNTFARYCMEQIILLIRCNEDKDEYNQESFVTLTNLGCPASIEIMLNGFCCFAVASMLYDTTGQWCLIKQSFYFVILISTIIPPKHLHRSQGKEQ